MEGLNGNGGNMPDLFAKVGPLPAWAWGAIAIGGYLFWSHTHATVPVADSGAVDTTDTQESVPDVTTTNDYGYASPVDPSSAGYDYNTVNDGGYGGTTSGTAFTSNQEWGVKAITTLIASGIPASTATSGVTLYLSGSNLTADQANAVSTAITLIGPPPLPMPIRTIDGSIPTQPDPTPTPSPAPAPTPAPTPTPSRPTAGIDRGTLIGKVNKTSPQNVATVAAQTGLPLTTVKPSGYYMELVPGVYLPNKPGAALSDGWHGWTDAQIKLALSGLG